MGQVLFKMWRQMSALHQAELEEDNAEFFLLLCNDVFLEIICWGNRRQLVKLESVGKRFHWNIERWLPTTPFLRLDLCLAPRLNIERWFWKIPFLRLDLLIGPRFCLFSYLIWFVDIFAIVICFLANLGTDLRLRLLRIQMAISNFPIIRRFY